MLTQTNWDTVKLILQCFVNIIISQPFPPLFIMVGLLLQLEHLTSQLDNNTFHRRDAFKWHSSTGSMPVNVCPNRSIIYQQHPMTSDDISFSDNQHHDQLQCRSQTWNSSPPNIVDTFYPFKSGNIYIYVTDDCSPNPFLRSSHMSWQVPPPSPSAKIGLVSY